MIGTVCVCIPPLFKGKNMKLILLLVFLSNAAVGVSYVLTGGLNGGVSCLIGAAQAIINYFFERKGKNLPVPLIAAYAVTFTVANLLVFSAITDLLAVLACLIYIVMICQKNGRSYRLWALTNTALWITYDALNTSWGPLLTHGVLILITIFGVIVHDLKLIKKKAE